MNFITPNRKLKRVHKYFNFKGKRGTSWPSFSRRLRFIIKSTDKGLLTYNQIEAVRKRLTRGFKKKRIILKFRTYPTYPFTRKSLGLRQGKGKGNIQSIRDWKADVRRGRVLFAIFGRPRTNILREAFSKVSYKLPYGMKLLHRYFIPSGNREWKFRAYQPRGYTRTRMIKRI